MNNGVSIVPVDDAEFREKMVRSFTAGDQPRNREIHFTDLINCLACSFIRKVTPEPITEDKYNDLLDWMRGIGFDTKITDRFSGKARVVIGRAQGNVDMIFPSDEWKYDIPYELTSTPFLPKDIDQLVVDGKRYAYKVEQLKLYMAALCIPHGRLKIIQMVNVRKGLGNGKSDVGKDSKRGTPTTSPKGPVAHGPPQHRSRLQTRDHTYDVFLTPLALAEHRMQIIRRQARLAHALDTGRWWTIPTRYHPILADAPCADKDGVCSTWKGMMKDPKVVHVAWRRWKNKEANS